MNLRTNMRGVHHDKKTKAKEEELKKECNGQKNTPNIKGPRRKNCGNNV